MEYVKNQVNIVIIVIVICLREFIYTLIFIFYSILSGI